MSMGTLFSKRTRRLLMGGLVIAVVALAAFGVLAADPPLAYSDDISSTLGTGQVTNLPIEDNCTGLYAPPPYSNYYTEIDFYVTEGGDYDFSDSAFTGNAAGFRPYRMIYALGAFNPTNPVGCLYAKSTSNNATFTVTLAANTVYTLVMSHEGRIGVDGDEIVGAPGESFDVTLASAGAGEVCWSDTLGTCEDTDNDGVNDATDNCPTTPNADQANNYGTDNEGDACDDSDTDGVLDIDDACPTTKPVTDLDGDGCDDVDEEIGEEISTGGNELPFYVVDDRLNPLQGDNLAIAYEGVDGSLDLYCVRPDSTGILGLQIMPEDVPPADPDANTLVAQSEVCNVSFFVLSSGEYQVNIGPDFEGKVWELIFTSLDMDNMRSQVFVLD